MTKTLVIAKTDNIATAANKCQLLCKDSLVFSIDDWRFNNEPFDLEEAKKFRRFNVKASMRNDTTKILVIIDKEEAYDEYTLLADEFGYTVLNISIGD